MIGPDFDFVLGAFGKVSPFFQCSDDRQHFFVVDFVVAFHGVEAFG